MQYLFLVQTGETHESLDEPVADFQELTFSTIGEAGDRYSACSPLHP
jgi:hypothetical protein